MNLIWIIQFSCIINHFQYRFIMKTENWNLVHFRHISARFCPIFTFQLKWKRSRAELSWKFFSLSYGLSQLGSDSSLRSTHWILLINIFSVKYFSFNMFVTCLHKLLKMGSDKIIHWFCRFSFLLVFIRSEKWERLSTE